LRRRLMRDLLYFDSNIFIYPIVYDEAKVVEAKKSKDFLLQTALGKIEAYTSSITWDEVTWIVRKLFGIDFSLNAGRQFLSFPNLRLLGIKRTTVFKAHEIMEKYKLAPRDAIHAASALENKITTIVSYDKDFDSLEEIKRIEP
jgi:predicted nucleic acid-binding protein